MDKKNAAILALVGASVLAVLFFLRRGNVALASALGVPIATVAPAVYNAANGAAPTQSPFVLPAPAPLQIGGTTINFAQSPTLAPAVYNVDVQSAASGGYCSGCTPSQAGG